MSPEGFQKLAVGFGGNVSEYGYWRRVQGFQEANSKVMLKSFRVEHYDFDWKEGNSKVSGGSKGIGGQVYENGSV